MRDPQVIRPLGVSPNHWHHPRVERLVSSQSANEASEAVVNLNGLDCPLVYRKPICLVVHKYLTNRFKAWQCNWLGFLRYLVNLLVAYAISALVVFAMYMTPPSTLGYDQLSLGGGSSSVVWCSLLPLSMGVVVRLHSVRPQACAILVIASSWLSSSHCLPSSCSPRVSFMLRIHSHVSLYVIFLNRECSESFHHFRSFSLWVMLIRSSTYVSTTIRSPLTHLVYTHLSVIHRVKPRPWGPVKNSSITLWNVLPLNGMP